MAQVAFQETLNCLHCADCGIQFGITADFESRRRADHANFYCPMGHVNIYRGESETERLRRELAAKDAEVARARNRADMEVNARRSAQRQATRAKNELKRLNHRVNHGVCPHCQRTFKQLAAHMRTKHPDAG